MSRGSRDDIRDWVGTPTRPPNAIADMSSSTYPDAWTGTIFLNVSGGSIVNALARLEIEVRGGNWEEDFEIGMPEDVSSPFLRSLISTVAHHIPPC
jgi:hypothetical protein